MKNEKVNTMQNAKRKTVFAFGFGLAAFGLYFIIILAYYQIVTLK